MFIEHIKKGGGVSILIFSVIKSHYKTVNIQLNTIELCLVEIKLEHSQKNIVVGSLYRPPNTSCVEFVSEYEKSNQESKPCQHTFNFRHGSQ